MIVVNFCFFFFLNFIFHLQDNDGQDLRFRLSIVQSVPLVLLLQLGFLEHDLKCHSGVVSMWITLCKSPKKKKTSNRKSTVIHWFPLDKFRIKKSKSIPNLWKGNQSITVITSWFRLQCSLRLTCSVPVIYVISNRRFALLKRIDAQLVNCPAAMIYSKYSKQTSSVTKKW